MEAQALRRDADNKTSKKNFRTGELTDACRGYSTDKGPWDGNRHGYTFIYDRILPDLQPKKIVEIGLARRGSGASTELSDRRVNHAPSVDFWRTAFPEAHMVGFDISDFSGLDIENFTFVQGNAGSDQDIQNLTAVAQNADLVVDDGSHATRHQLLAMKYLFEALRPGGCYVIEDLNWQPKDIENKNDQGFTTADALTRVKRGMPLTEKMSAFVPTCLDHVSADEIDLFAHKDILKAGIQCKALFWKERMGVAARLAKAWVRRDDDVKLAVITKRGD